jgi:hypothetical protein
LLLVSLAVY